MSSEADRVEADLLLIRDRTALARREREIAAYQASDHFDLNVCCQHCSPPVRCVGLAIGKPEQVNDAGWDTATTVVCPKCTREFVLTVSMRPTVNPSAKAGQYRKTGT